MDPQGKEQRCLEYQYTKIGRQTYFGWWTHSESRIDALNTATPLGTWTYWIPPVNFNYEGSYLPGVKCNIGFKADLGRWTLREKSRDALNTSTPNWQTNLLWLMDPQWIKNRCLEYCYTKLGTWTYFGQWIPQWIENRCLEYCYTKLGR